MMSRTTYESTGGGYLQSSSQQSPNVGGGSKSRNIGGLTLRPLVIKSIYDSDQVQSDSPFTFCNYELHQVCVVGCIREVKSSATVVNYTIEDGTGLINVKQYVHKKGDSSMNEEDMSSGNKEKILPENTWVKVIGAIKSFDNSRYLMAHRIMAIDNYEDIVYQFMSFAYNHVQTLNAVRDYPSFDSKAGNDNTSYSKDFYNQSALPAEVAHLDPMKQNIFSVIMSCPTNEGLHVEEIVRNLRSQYQEHAIRESVGWLLSEGHIYNTHDDDHFKCAFQ